MPTHKILETDNYDGDYPEELFVNLPDMTEAHANVIAKNINNSFPLDYPRYWKSVPKTYVLKRGFQP